MINNNTRNSVDFNPRSRGGSDRRRYINITAEFNFNPRSRGGSDVKIALCFQKVYISIHAPAGGATTELHRPAQSYTISIHAPAGGATPCPMRNSRPCQHFNPRSRGGSDPLCIDELQVIKISIHAPAGGATAQRRFCKWSRLFQSTLPRGERRDQGDIRGGSCGISIHAPAGGATNVAIRVATVINISIHAPAGGATTSASRPSIT